MCMLFLHIIFQITTKLQSINFIHSLYITRYVYYHIKYATQYCEYTGMFYSVDFVSATAL